MTPIKLSRAYSINGAETDTLTMREPIVEDQLTIAALKVSDPDKELALFANLCGCSPSDLRKLAIRDYGRVQKAYRDFID